MVMVSVSWLCLSLSGFAVFQVDTLLCSGYAVRFFLLWSNHWPKKWWEENGFILWKKSKILHICHKKLRKTVCPPKKCKSTERGYEAWGQTLTDQEKWTWIRIEFLRCKTRIWNGRVNVPCEWPLVICLAINLCILYTSVWVRVSCWSSSLGHCLHFSRFSRRGLYISHHQFKFGSGQTNVNKQKIIGSVTTNR